MPRLGAGSAVHAGWSASLFTLRLCMYVDLLGKVPEYEHPLAIRCQMYVWDDLDAHRLTIVT